MTTTFTYDANGALVKKEEPMVGITYYVGTHYEVLVYAIFPPPAPADQRAEAKDLGLKEPSPTGWNQSRQVVAHLYGGTRPKGAQPCAPTGAPIS